ncbi:MAG: RNA 2',3'-cyclic phosphodiesterase [Sulfurimonas sp.]|nr:RNA 2',3'-cyclic phosphodiesterase [Sulfurimonas sp.]
MNRLFLALRAQLNDYDQLQSDFLASIKGRWVADENLHITMCYFGDTFDVDELLERLPPLLEVLKTIPLESLGYFEHNNILYAKAKSRTLETLQASICASLSLSNTQLFIPHVTLIRIKDIHNKKAFKQMLKNYKNKTIGELDTCFELINSHLYSSGASYESIKRFEL